MGEACFFLLLVLAAVAGWPVLLVFLTREWRRRRGMEGRGPHCGSCGYSTHGLAGLTCPECGSDLREVGIVVPRAVGNLSGWMLAAILGTLLVCILAATVVVVLGVIR